MNDPNGLVFLNGEYHLFYQYNPAANEWGDIGWAHAVSRDLLHWDELGQALPATEDGMVFSGSAVVDLENTSGPGDHDTGNYDTDDHDTPAMVAIYTCHSSANGVTSQTQNVASSVDLGRSWKRYPGNPVLDIGSASFRDPKVFWHAASGRWIMAVVLASDCKVQFHGSPDLLQWTYLSTFGPCGNTQGEWECPDLFPLPLENDPGQIKWILKVDNTLGAVTGGSGGQYFIGDFDGTQFTADQDETASDKQRGGAQPLDYGSDFYAAMTWSNLSRKDGGLIWLGWMSNWQYAREMPTHPWRGIQSLPRSLHLVDCDGGYRLAQRPVEELSSIRGRHRCWRDVELTARKAFSLEDSQSETLELILQLAVDADALVTLHIARSSGSFTAISADSRTGELSVDRRRTAAESFHPEFPACHRGPLDTNDGLVDIRVVLDHCCLEVFAGRGETVITDLVFPDGDAGGIDIVCERGTASIVRLDLWRLDAWPASSRS